VEPHLQTGQRHHLAGDETCHPGECRVRVEAARHCSGDCWD
jgi:hypothetical protein